MIGKDGQELHFEPLDEWKPLDNLTARENALMAQNWALINMAGDICRSKDVLTEEDAEELRDIWQQTLDIEREYARSRDTSWLDWFSRQWGFDPFTKKPGAA